MGTIVSTSKLNALKTTLSTNFAQAYKSPRPLFYPELCTTIPSTKKNVLVAIVDMMPEMREWIGDRVYNDPRAYSQLVENPHYELSMKVDADDVDDDDLGMAFLQSSYLGEAASKHPDVLAGAVLKNAHQMLCFDGQNFFDTDHYIDAKAQTGSQSNYSASGKALTATNWEEVRGIMGGWKAGPDGRIIGARPTHLAVPPQLEGTARRILEAERDDNGATNVNKGTAKVLVLDELASEATAWYPLDLRGIIKPLVYVRRKAPMFVMKNRPTDEGMFENNEIRFGVDQREGVGLGAWFRAYKAKA